ncbi:MAG: NAD(P)/FAD-dependent oxidoreductase [Halobacteriaceae archaeon]
MEHVDVGIVGGGPAGASAGRAAAAAGAETVVIEKGVPRADREGAGPDSTDAAGCLDYWVDIMGLGPDDFPEGVLLRELDRAEFFGPTESVTLDSTGMDSSYDRFGFTFDRARFDDWLRERAVEAGADYRVGTGVRSVESERADGGYRHRLALADGEEVVADRLVLADGPQRQVTMGALDQFLPGEEASTRLSPPRVNHIAYQEHRRLPAEVFDGESIKFWWGWMPGETAYPWIFPNDDGVARVGLTMPIGLDLDDVDEPGSYRLLREDDERIPQGGEYIRRLLAELYGDEYDVESAFPLVEDRGKSGGTETYPISSTRPIDSPTAADIAVAGGAMGTTSAFHEGGTHVAVRTGALAGDLAGRDRLGAYNDAWKEAIGDEVLRNVAMAEVVGEYRPADWDRAFRAARRMREAAGQWRLSLGAAVGARAGIGLYLRYKYRKFRNRDGRYVQLREAEYGL